MISRFTRTVAILFVILGMTSCIKDPEFHPAEFGISTEYIELSKEASQTRLSLLTNRDWTAEISSSAEGDVWLRLSDTVGTAVSDSTVLTLFALNNEGEDRYATVRFKVGTGIETVVIYQKGVRSREFTPIRDVRALYSGSDVTVSEDLVIRGTVISNYRSSRHGGLNNSPSLKTVVIADREAGISLYLKSANDELAPGAIVAVHLKGLQLQRFSGGALQVDGVPAESIECLLNEGPLPEPIAITAEQLCTGEYESRYVAVSDVQVAEEDLDKTFVLSSDKHHSIHMEAKTGEKFLIFSSRYSSYGREKVPSGSGTVKGIAMVYRNTDYQISFTRLTDYADLVHSRFLVK